MIICNIRNNIMPGNNKSAINERRQKLFALLTRGMKGYEIAKEERFYNMQTSCDIVEPLSGSELLATKAES